MGYAQIMVLILDIAALMNIPPYFALSIALTENPQLNPMAVNVNENGTVDRGVMQLNSCWFVDENWSDPETNIRAGCTLIREILSMPKVNTYWSAAVVYNAGYGRLTTPPESAIEYANRVVMKWRELDRFYYRVLIPGKI